jgi:hypothetical protein
LTLHGRLRVHESGGQVQPIQRGSLYWSVSVPSSSTASEAQAVIMENEWTLTVRSDAILEPSRIHSFEGRTARPRPLKIPAHDADGMVVEADWEPGVLLHVLDAVDRSPIRAVQLVLASSIQDLPTRSLSPPDSLVEKGPALEHDSPMPLPSMLGTDVAWVTASGYAWARFAFTGSKGERTVFLDHAGQLECVVEGLEAEERGCVVRLRPSPSTEPTVLSEKPLRDRDRVLFERVPARSVVVSLERPGPDRVDSRLAEAVVEVLPGRLASVHLDLRDPVRRSGLGTLDVHLRSRAASASYPSVTRVLLLPLGVDPGKGPLPAEVYAGQLRQQVEDHSYVWRVRGLAPGDYLVQACPALRSERVHVEPNEEGEIELILDDLCDVRVSLMLPESGGPTDNGSVRARCVAADGPEAWQEAAVDHRERVYELECAPGPVVLSASVDGRRGIREEVELHPGSNVFTFTMEKEARIPIRLRAFEGEAECPLPLDMWCAVKVDPTKPCNGSLLAVGGGKQVGGRTTLETSSATLWVSEAGSYLIRFPLADGYLPLDDLPVCVRAEAPTESVIQMIRSPSSRGSPALGR